MFDAKKWMCIPLNLKVELKNLTVAYEKVECSKRKLECCINQSWMLNAKKLNCECKLKWQTQKLM